MLESIRVLDLSQYIPGPFAAQLLADLGAEVVKVEPPAGDPMRRFGPEDQNGLSPLYTLANRNKTIVNVDLKTEAGKDQFRQLVQSADVLLESYRPGVLERLGFSRAVLKDLNPTLVHCALSGFGQTGPYRLRAGHDINYMALAGGLEASGTQAQAVLPFPPVADHATALTAAFSICAALFQQQRKAYRALKTGQETAKDDLGCYIDIGLSDAILAWQAPSLTAAARGAGDPFHDWLLPRGGGLLNGGVACYRLYPCQDGGTIAMGALEEKFWITFCTAFDKADWIPLQYQDAAQADLMAGLESLFLSRPAAAWREALAGLDCCVEVVEPLERMPDHPHLQARGLLHAFDNETGPLVEALFPALLNESPSQARRPLAFSDIETILSRWADS